MKKSLSLYRMILSGLLVLSLAGCNLLGSDDPEAGTVTVELNNRINAQAITLNNQAYTSAAGHNYSVTLLEYILTDLTLVAESGEEIVITAAHYVNAEDDASLSIDPVEIPAGVYSMLKFTFGVTGENNVFGNLDRSLEMDNMLWPMMMPMGDGQTERYHYMRFEGRYGADNVFRIHTGPSGGSDYSIDVELPADFDVDGENWGLEIDINLDQWLTGPNNWDFDDYGMIMGNPAAQSIIYENGNSVFDLDHAHELGHDHEN